MLERTLPKDLTSPWIITLMSSCLFGADHAKGGLTYVALSALAGIGYSLAARRAGGITGSIAAYITLDSMHFLFFTYPALPR
ncbi:MAG: CPBP family intramembrane metalloprotease [Hymenobacter sp.]|nr:MAG: CPBP family intramembrane metalloprotease [Hymenobacter sp.]